MLKYVETLVSFSEVPDEITLCINISNCPCGCIGCHSSYLSKDIGEELTIETLDKLITKNKGITCVSFMGGDREPEYINELAFNVKLKFPIKVTWYSGKSNISKEISLCNFDYIKIGPYIEELGGLTSSNTNQIMYMVDKKTKNPSLIDITYKFHK